MRNSRGKRQKRTVSVRVSLTAALLAVCLFCLSGCWIEKPVSYFTGGKESRAESSAAAAETPEKEPETEDAETPEETAAQTEDAETPEETARQTEKAEETLRQETEEESRREEKAAYVHELPWGSAAPEIPDYAGEPRYELNGNLPYFDTEEKGPDCCEFYGELDALGRCTGCEAVIGKEIMPTEKRGNISSVHPTAWHKDKYSFVDGENLYNRCHLIAHMFTGQNANERNLITGTRYMNTLGMNDLENGIGDYIRRTGNHVRYRVTPVFSGDNLLADGVIMEAWSIEDRGQGVCFCVYAYNVQPGIGIDYATGDNWLLDGEDAAYAPEEDRTDAEDTEGTYILNRKTKKFHLPACSGAGDIHEENREEYTGSRNELLREGYEPCGSCKP